MRTAIPSTVGIVIETSSTIVRRPVGRCAGCRH